MTDSITLGGVNVPLWFFIGVCVGSLLAGRIIRWYFLRRRERKAAALKEQLKIEKKEQKRLRRKRKKSKGEK